MSGDASIEQLLRWRLARAEAEAPPPPSAARLLALSRPWWETWPERFEALAQRLRAMPLSYGYALAAPLDARRGHPVPTLIARAEGVETFARVLYLAVRDGWLRLRFQLDAAPGFGERAFDVTFVGDDARAPLLTAHATLSVDAEYRLDAELPDALAGDWATLKVTDPMPFRLILHPGSSAGGG